MSWLNPLGYWRSSPPQQQHQHQTDTSPHQPTTPSYTYEVRPRPATTHHTSHQHPQHGKSGSPRSSAASLSRNSQARDRDDIIVKYKSTQYPISFRAWSVDDGALLVGDVRNEVARLFKDVSPSSVRLIVRGKRLDDDRMSMRDAGFRSERPEVILCTISEGPAFNRPAGSDALYGEAAEEEDEDGSGSDEDDEDGSAAAANGTGKNKRKSRNRKKRRKAKATTPSTHSSSTALPYPTGTTSEYLPMPSNAHPLHRTSTAGGYSPSPSPAASSPKARTQTPPQPSPNPPASATSSSSALASGPMSKLEAIASKFHVEIVPKVVQFLSSPPTDKAKRDFDKKRFTETIEREVVIKYDAVELDGDSEARARRKELIKEAQAMLSRLDEFS